MNILLTGATGGLGYRTLEKLITNPQINHIIASGRTIKASHFVENEKVQYITGDLSDLKYTMDLVSQVDYIIHAAALSSPWGKYSNFETANITSMKYLLSAAEKYAIKRFIYISTPSIYFDFSNRLNIKETDYLPKTFVNNYSRTKYEAELELTKSAIPYVILRPRALVGRGDNVIMTRLIRSFKEGKLKIIGDGNNVVDLTAIANVADAIELSLFTGAEGINQIYNISNGNPVKIWETIAKVLTLLGYEMNKSKVPYQIAIFYAQLLEWAAKLSNYKEPALTKYSVGTIAKSYSLDISKARKLLGYIPKVSTDEAIVEFVNWYKQNEGS